MAKTIEMYVRGIDPIGAQADAALFQAEGNLTEQAMFVPALGFTNLCQTQERLAPIFGRAADQIFVTKGLEEGEATRPTVITTGICPFPMEYNAQLTPAPGKPGTAKWRTSRTAEPFFLPPTLPDAIDLLVGNPPPVTLPNLMKAGGVGVAPTVLIEEEGFYTDWMMGKLVQNCASPPTSEVIEAQCLRLGAYIREQFVRNRRCFEKLRSLVLGDVTCSPVTTVSDTEPIYRLAMKQQVAEWQANLPQGEDLDEAGLAAAAFYSTAVTRAYRELGVIAQDAALVVAEGAANVVIPSNGLPFNNARRAAFRALTRVVEGSPAIAVFPSSNTCVSLRKNPLEQAAVASVPSSWKPDIANCIEWPKRDRPPALGVVMSWSYAVPDTERLSSLQRQMMSGQDVENALLAEMRKVSIAILSDSEIGGKNENE